eukprot:PhF_6_TR1005/c0_g1_i2/m.2002
MNFSIVGPMVDPDITSPIPIDRAGSSWAGTRFPTEVRYRCFHTSPSHEIGRIEDETLLLPRKRYGVDPIQAGFSVSTIPIDCVIPTSSEDCAQRQYECYRYILTSGKLKSSLRALAALKWLNIVPSAACYTTVLTQCNTEGNADVALETVEAIVAAGYPLRPDHYRSVFQTLEKCGKPFHAAALLMDGNLPIDDSGMQVFRRMMSTVPMTEENLRKILLFMEYVEWKGSTHLDPQIVLQLAMHHATLKKPAEAMKLLEKVLPVTRVPENVLTAVLSSVLGDTELSPMQHLTLVLRLFTIAVENNIAIPSHAYPEALRVAILSRDDVAPYAIFQGARNNRCVTLQMFVEILKHTLVKSQSQVLAVVFENPRRTMVARNLLMEAKSYYGPLAQTEFDNHDILSLMLSYCVEDNDLATATWVLCESIALDRVDAVTKYHDYITSAGSQGNLSPETITSALKSFMPHHVRIIQTCLRHWYRELTLTSACNQNFEWLSSGVDALLTKPTTWSERLCPNDRFTIVLLDSTALHALVDGDLSTKFIYMMSDYSRRDGGYAIVLFSTLLELHKSQKTSALRLVIHWLNHYPWMRILPLSTSLEIAHGMQGTSARPFMVTSSNTKTSVLRLTDVDYVVSAFQMMKS